MHKCILSKVLFFFIIYLHIYNLPYFKKIIRPLDKVFAYILMFNSVRNKQLRKLEQ